MAKFLDQTGLVTLWNKIKETFTSKDEFATYKTFVADNYMKNPVGSGVEGQVLTLNSNSTYSWKTPASGGSDYKDGGYFPERDAVSDIRFCDVDCETHSALLLINYNNVDQFKWNILSENAEDWIAHFEQMKVTNNPDSKLGTLEFKVGFFQSNEDIKKSLFTTANESFVELKFPILGSDPTPYPAGVYKVSPESTLTFHNENTGMEIRFDNCFGECFIQSHVQNLGVAFTLTFSLHFISNEETKALIDFLDCGDDILKVNFYTSKNSLQLKSLIYQN